MASFTKLHSGSWRVQVRRKGRYVSETFLRRDDARRWALEAERQIDRGETPNQSRIARLKTFGDLIDLHIDDMCDVGKPPRRSKAATLDMLKRQLGKCNMAALDRERLIRFGRDRATKGAGPATLGIDIGTIKLILSHAAAVHGLPVTIEAVDLARIALKQLGLVGKGQERDRRPTQDELDRLISHFDANPRQIAPIGRIIRFAVATAMRQEEICTVRWSDLECRTRMLLIRDRKDPRNKQGNNQRIPLFAACGYDAWAIVEEQRACRSNNDDRIFPYNGRSVGTAFRRGCADLSIHDLHFHDLRHEGTSRLFEAGFTIEQVALVTGHKDWKMLKRYTHLKPEALHALLAARAA
ncbi:site-specific integrase [Aminobacter sp. NyZ550]|uniref:Integrase n=1 Tax=Aminobacter carboxidus TaxID=376165 RepID=A0A8E2BBD5_9HYPH|nr:MULTISPECIES: site-specific integrase [Aminobacter]MBB6464994.1 integrase [Aminobacter lissarensis]MDR7224712.1 integrase [Aminobacter aminovorans]MRX37544.1 tyrosine-type recombinase/integrase [Aminobacter sp. MDW-2]QNH33833.1 site-specific integrase [Aminobacter sp. MDW-2]WAX94828.1 site-specific integrase [Aminobacter sp. NyZ550]